ncbi:MAG TPA: hypothetical protein VK203_27495 [Nostocaceae cyanobacterium]|nr:hypothetical protein [Nostocaceae cyanobacterium]
MSEDEHLKLWASQTPLGELIFQVYNQHLAEEKAKLEAEKTRKEQLIADSIKLFQLELDQAIPPHIQEELKIEFSTTTEITENNTVPGSNLIQAKFNYAHVFYTLIQLNENCWELRNNYTFREFFSSMTLFRGLLIQLGKAEELNKDISRNED